MSEKAVIYARYSSSNQREESIEGQIRECKKYAKYHDMIVIGEYTDHALTGRTDKRPGFQKMIADSEKGAFDVVICWKIDRFARNRFDSATYKYRLKKNGVRLAYAVESIPDGPEGIILESVMEGYAEYYSENLAQNIRRGMYENALACKVLSSTCFGYNKGADGKYEINEEEGEMVKRIFREYLSGVPCHAIAEELNACGFRSYRGKKFSKTSIAYILRNEKYKGVYQYKDIRVENGIPALISPSDFEDAQMLMKKHASAPAASQGAYLLSTKLHCGECGGNYVGEYATSRNGALHYYYTCMGKRSHTCEMKRRKKDEIEKLILDEIIKLIFDDEFIDEVSELVVECQKELEKNTMIPVLEEKEKDTQKRLDNLTAAIEGGLRSPTVQNRVYELEKELEDIRVELGKEIIKTPMLDKDQIKFFLLSLRKGDPHSQKYKERIVDTFLQGAYIYKDRIVIFLNYTGKKSPITKEIADTLKAPKNGASNSVRLGTDKSRSLFQIRTSTYLFGEFLVLLVA